MKRNTKRSGMRWWCLGILALLPGLVGCESSDSGISVSSVTWLDQDVSNWAQTAGLKARISGGTVQLDYNKSRTWPMAATRAKDGGVMNANCWVIAKVDGKWYGATFEWLRVGATSRLLSTVFGPGHIVYGPLNTHVPRSGDKIGFMVSTPARTNERTLNERSNISWVTWP